MLIMIIDGDATRRGALYSMLSKRGHTLRVATNRTDAIKIFRWSQVQPRLILIDPDCEGASADDLLRVILDTSPKSKLLLLPTPVAV